MFRLESYKADIEQNWLVSQFENFQFNEPFSGDKFVPRADIAIIFHFKETPLVLKEKNIKLKPFFATPILSRSLTLHCQGMMDSFVVICKPTVFSRIFNINLSTNSEQIINLPDPIFYPVWKDLSALKSLGERISYFTRFINQVQKTTYVPDAIDQLYNQIMAKGTTTLLKDLMLDCCACKRTLERNFLRRTGISSKTLVRIARLNYLLQKIKNKKVVDYQDLVVVGNYFDQAHFINDFKDIIGETPGTFLKRDLQLTRMFSN
ncbi:MAG: helix-turn-helix domain-containing protein [Bacteroidota bacterium]|nr:helix-turn-helix domain-containing protein [Bacteroidota bacterium]MDP4273354.1 helix-turn-helix domain-containing protein [Bacteroidota bacterium]